MGDVDYEEEQALELEALEAIYLEDYELVDGTPGSRTFRLRLVPIPGEESAAENKVAILASFKLPANYFDAVPEVTIAAEMGLTDKQCEELVAKCNEEAQDLIGQQMIFTLAESLKEWLVENNRDHTDESMHAQMLAKAEAEEREKLAKKEAEERSRRIEREDNGESEDAADVKREITGTAVTRENFLEWHAKFVEELRAKEEAEAGPGRTSSKGLAADAHLTGREYFELKAQEKLNAGPAGEGEAGAGAVEEWDTEIQEDLFLEDEEDLDDLDDLDSSEGDEDDDDGEEED